MTDRRTCLACLLGLAFVSIANLGVRAEPLTQLQKDRIKQCLLPGYHWLPHCQHSWNKCGIPPGNYAEVPVSGSMRTLPGVLVSETVFLPDNTKGTRLSKVFRLSTPALQVNYITLDQVGLSIEDDGQVHFSTRLFNHGGLHKELLGNNIHVILRAYAGQNREGTPLLLPRAESAVGGPAVWEAHVLRWLPAQVPQVITVAPGSVPEIRAHFAKITGFEVTLEYEKGR